MSRGKKLTLFLLFLIYLASMVLLPLRGRMAEAADAFGLWRIGEKPFPLPLTAVIAGLSIGLLALTYTLYYMFAESRKYFPMVPRAAMWLLLIAAAATEASLRYLAPLLENGRFGLSAAAAARLPVAVPAAVTGLAALFILGAARRAVKRAAAVIREITAGGSTRLNQFSGDELQTLALAVNSFAKEYAKSTQGARRRDESYIKFVPRQLVQLMGVESIGDVNRHTALARVMAVLAVRFKLPDAHGNDAETLFAQVNEVITRSTEFVHKNDGVIYNFYHDGYEAVFSGTAADAVSAAVAMRQDMQTFNKEREENGELPVELHTAVDKGEVMLGVIGDESRLTPAAVSACLNSARHLAKLAEQLDSGILCTMDVALETESYAQRYIGKHAGADSKRVYEIFDGDLLEARAAKEKTRVQFAEGVYLLYARDFSGARRIFMDIIRLSAADGVSRFYLFLADGLEKSGGEGGEEQLYLTLRGANNA
jgi:hypothetical protein